MQSLPEETWDVVLAGTGLPQSLLALALSRSGKKVLHLDRNDYYGGAEAALSLDEATTWAASSSKDPRSSPFRNVVISEPEPDATHSSKLGFSRAYSLALAPQLIYNRSNLLPALVSSKVYQQMEFLAVGSWWIYDQHTLRKIPSSREDVVNDQTIDLRSKRNVMRFLQLAASPESHLAAIEEHGLEPFPAYLQAHFKISEPLQATLLALTLSPELPLNTLTSFALKNIHRHLTSIGLFGPGFGAVIPKWGGLAEVAQVACRAGAVGGGVYVLGWGIEKLKTTSEKEHGHDKEHAEPVIQIRLTDGEMIKSKTVGGSRYDVPTFEQDNAEQEGRICRIISIISSPLDELFPTIAEGAPPPAAAVIVFPSGSLDGGETSEATMHPPVHLMIHTAESGECPADQCVIYGHTATTTPSRPSLLSLAVSKLLRSLPVQRQAQVIWSMQYQQCHPPSSTGKSLGDASLCPDVFPSLILEDDVLRDVRSRWESITENDAKSAFMTFQDREGVDSGDNDDDGDDDMS